MRIYAYAPQRDSGFFGDDGSDVRYDTDVVVPHYTQCDGVLGPLGFTRPACLYDTVSETLAQVARVRAIATVYFDTAAYGDKAEYLVAVDWIAATCQFEVQPFQVLVDDEHVLLGICLFGQGGCLQVITFGATVDDVVVRIVFPFLQFKVLVYDVVHVERFVGDALIEVRHHFEAEAFDEAHHRALVIFYFPVLEFAFQCFFGKCMLAGSHFLECLPYLGACFGSCDDVQPALFGGLRVGSHDFHLVAAVQYLLQLCVPAVYFCSDAFAAQFAVDMESEVEYGGTFAQLK